MKLLLGQFALVFFVWLGLFSFFDSMGNASKVVFYFITSYMLLLVVLIIREFFGGRKER